MFKFPSFLSTSRNSRPKKAEVHTSTAIRQTPSTDEAMNSKARTATKWWGIDKRNDSFHNNSLLMIPKSYNFEIVDKYNLTSGS